VQDVVYPADSLLPSELVEFFLGTNKLHSAVVKKNATALWIMVIEGKQFGAAVLIPALFGLEQKDCIRWRIGFTIGIHRVRGFTFAHTGTNMRFR
jgi:hypothetical protein